MDYYFDLLEKKKRESLCQIPFEPMAVFSDETENFRKPAEPSAEDFVEIFLRTAQNNVLCVYLCMDNRKRLMEKVKSQKKFDYYRVLLPPTKDEKQYYFELHYNDEIYYYSHYGVAQELPTQGFFRVVRDFYTPQWAKGAVLYQIYVDRFCNGDPSNDVKSGEYRYLGELVTGEKEWLTQPGNEDFRHFYGGDLAGVMQKLDYLAGLGIEAIYLNPIFISPSSHKYDIQDYDHIDPHFGKIVVDQDKILQGDESNARAVSYITRTTDERNLMASDALFAELIAKAHKKGIRVIIDGVFNHCGAFHKWLDREKIYLNQKKGAFYCNKSPYHDYFYWNPDGSYEGWWGYENHPKLNMESCRALYWEIMRIGQKWVSAPYHADGWRLDVAADLGKSEAFNHKFWHDFRKAVKDANPEAIILAEHYGDANRWLEGDQWDSVMNYDAFMEPVSWFFTGISKHSTESREDLYNNTEVFWTTMYAQSCSIPMQAAQVAMNELSNHDHSRFLTRTNHRTGRLHTDGALSADLGVSRAVFRQAVLVQMTWTGAPTIYYGDEVGMTGWTDPDNRRPFPWGREDDLLIEYHRVLIHLRKKYKALRFGSIKSLSDESGVLAYGRFQEREKLVIVCNNTKETKTITLPVWTIGIGLFSKMQVLLRTEQMDFFTKSDDLWVANGVLSLEMPPQSGILMKEV